MFRSVILKNLKEKIDIYSLKKKNIFLGEIVDIPSFKFVIDEKYFCEKKKINENCLKISIKIIKHRDIE